MHDVRTFWRAAIAARGAAQGGITWHLCRPPISGLEFEMDARSVSIERTV